MCNLCRWWLTSPLKIEPVKPGKWELLLRYQSQAGQGNGGQPPTVHPELTSQVPGALAQGSLELGAPDSASCAA